jgi:hypothetical protein
MVLPLWHVGSGEPSSYHTRRYKLGFQSRYRQLVDGARLYTTNSLGSDKVQCSTFLHQQDQKTRLLNSAWKDLCARDLYLDGTTAAIRANLHLKGREKVTSVHEIYTRMAPPSPSEPTFTGKGGRRPPPCTRSVPRWHHRRHSSQPSPEREGVSLAGEGKAGGRWELNLCT